jgi:uncharacterized protein YndB with AHSA1/START domain
MNQISISTTITVPISTAWECFTHPNHVKGWNFASTDWECPTASNDLKVGGRFCYVMAAKDKSVEFNFTGIFTTVETEKCLEYTLCEVDSLPIDSDRRVRVTFTSDGENTIVTETFDPENENSEELQQRGWQSILDNFKLYTEQVYEDETIMMAVNATISATMINPLI